MTTQIFKIDLLDSSEKQVSADVSYEVEYGRNGIFETRVCTVHLNCELGEFIGAADDCFDAFAEIREKLAPLNVRPLCYGASRNVYPSGMSRDMGLGLKAYKLTLGEKSKTADLVSIFDTGPDLDIVSVEDQRQFAESWMNSIKVGTQD